MTSFPPLEAQSFNQTGPTVTAFETIDDGPHEFGVKVANNTHCGVYGESMEKPPPVGIREAATPHLTGVSGRGDENGVWGMSERNGASGVGLSGTDEKGKPIYGIGVAGFSLQNRAGVFTGIGISHVDNDNMVHSFESDPNQHPAQVRMVPYPPFDDQNKPQKLPKNGLAGDFFVVMGGRNNEAILWFCVRSHDSTVTPPIPASWEQISSLGGIRRDGGTSAHL